MAFKPNWGAAFSNLGRVMHDYYMQRAQEEAWGNRLTAQTAAQKEIMAEQLRLDAEAAEEEWARGMKPVSPMGALAPLAGAGMLPGALAGASRVSIPRMAVEPLLRGVGSAIPAAVSGSFRGQKSPLEVLLMESLLAQRGQGLAEGLAEAVDRVREGAIGTRETRGTWDGDRLKTGYTYSGDGSIVGPSAVEKYGDTFYEDVSALGRRKGVGTTQGWDEVANEVAARDQYMSALFRDLGLQYGESMSVVDPDRAKVGDEYIAQKRAGLGLDWLSKDAKKDLDELAEELNNMKKSGTVYNRQIAKIAAAVGVDEQDAFALLSRGGTDALDELLGMMIAAAAVESSPEVDKSSMIREVAPGLAGRGK